jgi:ABC-type hemin transport system ATPase subunit
MDDNVEALFERLSEKYITKINEDRKVMDDRQLLAFKAAMQDIIQAKKIDDGKSSNESQFTEHDLIRGALSEAKERQSKVIMVPKCHKISYCILNVSP